MSDSGAETLSSRKELRLNMEFAVAQVFQNRVVFKVKCVKCAFCDQSMKCFFYIYIRVVMTVVTLFCKATRMDEAREHVLYLWLDES